MCIPVSLAIRGGYVPENLVPQIPKPLVQADIYENFLAIRNFPPFSDPRIVKTANTKSTNNMGKIAAKRFKTFPKSISNKMQTYF